MFPNNDRDPMPQNSPSVTPEDSLLGGVPTPPNTNSTPTFPPDAESLLRHLNLAPAKSPPTPDASANPAFPQIPSYEIESEIGRGGMGIVYKARHTTLRRTDAVKMILTSAHATPSEVARFLAEAEAIAAVKHQNVVQVYGLGDSDGRPYFVMEYIEGGNLALLLKGGGHLAPKVGAELIAAVALGVQAAHDAGIVHRDLKPANILLVSKSESEDSKVSPSNFDARISNFLPKVSDFGLAKRLMSDLTRSQAVMGTPAYMAPEQAGKAKFVGPGADIYALGVLLYECITGTVPFDSPDAWSLIRQLLEDPPPSPRTHVPNVPRDLELICLKCLEKEPHDRYPTAAALADDLNRFLRDEPVSVRPISTFKRVTRWTKRHPAPAALIALTAVLLLVVPPLAVWEQGRLNDRDLKAHEEQQKAEIERLEKEKEKLEKEKALIAKREAEQLAATQDLFALQTRLRNHAVARPIGWTRETRQVLPRAVTLAGNDADTLTDLRSMAATAILAPDLAPLDPILKRNTVCAVATDPKTGRIAFGEFHAMSVLFGLIREPLHVWIVDPASGEIVHEWSFPAGDAVNAKGSSAPDDVRALAFSSDGKQLFAGTRSGSIIRFDLDKLEKTPTKKWTVAKTAIDQLAVSPRGNTVYGLCSQEKPVFAWNAETGKLITKLEPQEGRFNSFTVLPSGEVVAGHDHRLYHWNSAHKLVGTVPRVVGNVLTATSNSMFLVGSGASLEVYDRDGFDPTDRYFDPKLRIVAHEESLRSIALHPSGVYAATAAGDKDRTVKVWELSSGRLIGTVTSPGTTPIRLAWSGDGQYLLATSGSFVSRWRFSLSEPQQFACMNGNTVALATFLSNGSVATLGETRNGKRELNIELAGKRLYSHWLQDPGGLGRVGLAGAPDASLLATLDTPGIFRWQLGTPLPPLGFTKQIARCPRMSPDGKKLWAIVNSDEVHSYDPATQKLKTKWSNRPEEILTGLSTHDALAVGRKAVVAGCVNGTVYVLDPASGQQVMTFPRREDPILSVAITPDDSLIVAGTQSGRLRVLDPATKTELPPVAAHTDGATAVTINRDGTLLVTGGRDCMVKVWKRVGDRFELLFTVSALPGAVRELQFNQADNRLLVQIAHTHAVRVWNIDQLRTQLAELKLGW